MKIKLPDNISSTQDIASLIIELHDYSRWFNQESIIKHTHATHDLEPPIISKNAQDLIDSCDSEKQLEQHDIDELISELEKLKNNLPVINITLAALPTSTIKTDIVKWCRNNISDNILVNFWFNATLLGGMVVRYKSHVFDWSFKRQILANRAKFPEVLKNVR